MLSILFDTSIDLEFRYRIILFVLVAAALIISIILHEISHGYVAFWCGDDTAKRYGRLSLNPAKHFDLIGCLMVLFVGFGYAKPVPVNPYNFRSYRKGCILVSLAGVTMNIILSLLSALMYVLCVKFAFNIIIMYFFMYFGMFNACLCFFNLLPFFPLDGFNFLDALFNRKNGFLRAMRNYGQYILLALVLISVLVDRVGAPIFFSPLDLYIDYTASYVYSGFIKLFALIFGV